MLFAAKTTGAKQILAALEALPDKVQARVLREVGADALQPVARAMAAGAPVGKGPAVTKKGKARKRYRETIGVSTKVSSKQRRFVRRETDFQATVHAGAGSRLSYIVEHGTKARYTKAGASRGRMPARPHLHPAWSTEGPQLAERVGRMLWQRLTQGLRR